MHSESERLNLLGLKGRLLLTIFGSYDSGALARLRSLKECLIRKGYIKCRLVSDYAYPPRRKNESNDQYFLRKSIYWLENSDACIFVFLHDFDSAGVALELKHTCDHLHSKLETCLVTIEWKCSRYSTSLIRGTVTNLVIQRKLNRRFFKNDAQLCKFCSSSAISFLKKRRFYLLERL